jgi:hypothetical protein
MSNIFLPYPATVASSLLLLILSRHLRHLSAAITVIYIVLAIFKPNSISPASSIFTAIRVRVGRWCISAASLILGIHVSLGVLQVAQHWLVKVLCMGQNILPVGECLWILIFGILLSEISTVASYISFIKAFIPPYNPMQLKSPPLASTSELESGNIPSHGLYPSHSRLLTSSLIYTAPNTQTLASSTVIADHPPKARVSTPSLTRFSPRLSYLPFPLDV